MNEETMIKDMYNAIELPESNITKDVLSQIHDQKKVTRRRSFGPAVLAATMAVIMLTTGFTIFADDIAGLIKQERLAGGIINQVEELIGEEDTVIAIQTFPGSKLEDFAKEDWKLINYDSLDEMKANINFTPIEPEGLTDNWELRAISGCEYGGIIDDWIELIYHDPSTNPKGERYYSLDEIPRNIEFYVYQRYLGEDAFMDIYTTQDIQNITVDGIDMILSGSMPYDWHNAYSLTWVQDGIMMEINPSCSTYDELITFAETFTASIGE